MTFADLLRLLRGWTFLAGVAFAVAVVFGLYAENLGEVSLPDLPVPLAAAVLAAAIPWLVLLPIVRNPVNRGLASFVATTAFFAYGHVFALLQRAGLALRHRHLLLANSVLVAIAVLALSRSRRAHDLAYRVVSVGAVAMLAIAGGTVVVGEARVGGQPSQAHGLLGTPPEGAPDVLYLVLDGYARSDSLRDLFEFNNTPFESGLEALGFDVLSGSTSNYPGTFLSVPSVLHMDYLGDLLDGVKDDDAATRVLRDSLYASAAAREFRSHGYESVFLHSWVWPGTPGVSQVDHDIQCGRLREFTALVFRTTILGPVLDYRNADEARARLDCTFDRIPTLRRADQPRFIVSHVLAPHSPFVFNADGSPVTASTGVTEAFPRSLDEWEEERQLYLGQLQYTNARVLEAVEAFLKASDRPAVIVVQGDHGWQRQAGYEPGWVQGTHADAIRLAKPEYLNERYRVLTAVYASPGIPLDPPQDLASVNTLRLVLNAAFGDNRSMLDVQHWFACCEHPYELRRVQPDLVSRQVLTDDPGPYRPDPDA